MDKTKRRYYGIPYTFNLTNKRLAEFIISKDKKWYKHWSKVLRLNLDKLLYNTMKDSKIEESKIWYIDSIEKLILSRCNVIDKE